MSTPSSSRLELVAMLTMLLTPPSTDAATARPVHPPSFYADAMLAHDLHLPLHITPQYSAHASCAWGGCNEPLVARSSDDWKRAFVLLLLLHDFQERCRRYDEQQHEELQPNQLRPIQLQHGTPAPPPTSSPHSCTWALARAASRLWAHVYQVCGKHHCVAGCNIEQVVAELGQIFTTADGEDDVEIVATGKDSKALKLLNDYINHSPKSPVA